MELKDFTALVVGVDGSPAADRAAAWACQFADRHDLSVRLLMMVSMPVPPSTDTFAGPISHWYTPQLVEDHLDAMRAQVNQLAELNRARFPQVDITAEVQLGAPAHGLIAATGPSEILVVGRQGRDGIVEHLLGSTTDAVLSHSKQPVVVVPMQGDWSPDGPVVVGVDDQGSCQALHLAAQIASSHHTTLQPVTVVHFDPSWTTAFDDRMPELMAANAMERLDDLLEPVTEQHPDLTVDAILVDGKPVDALVKRSRGASLVVVGSRGRGGFTGLLLGSTSRRIAGRSLAPVMVVRSESTPTHQA